MANPNVLSDRYATPEINEIFSPEGTIFAYRDLWFRMLHLQKDLGVDIPIEVVGAYMNSLHRIDFTRTRELEEKSRHDVNTHKQVYNEAAGSDEIHKAMTSRDLTDNVEQIQIKRASEIIFGKYVSVLRHFIDKAQEYKDIELTARTHHQPAQMTLLGKRFATRAEELHRYLRQFKKFIKDYPLRGIKGPVGTQMDMVNLLGSREKVSRLEKELAKYYGFNRIMVSTGQVYPRSLDFVLGSNLVALSSAPDSFAHTMRLMAGYEHGTEGFKPGQVGSSAMPHKMNTRSSERINSFAKDLRGTLVTLMENSGTEWEEGDVSCSLARRSAIPNLFYLSDGICETTLTVLNEMGVYPAMIDAEIERFFPFLATTALRSAARERGMEDGQAYKIIQKAAKQEALEMREEGKNKNELADVLGKDSDFPLDSDEIKELFSQQQHDVGTAHLQISEVTRRVNRFLNQYPIEAEYEPQPIL